EQGQRCRVEYREDQAQRALTDYIATDRVIDLAKKSAECIALRRWYPVVDNRHHLLPIIDEIAGNDWGHHQEGENRDQRSASGPNRTQKIAKPGSRQGGKFADRLLGVGQAFSHELAQPRPIWIGRELPRPSDVERKIIDEI